MNRALYTILQLTWGIPQTLAGLFVFLLNIGCPHKMFHGAVCTSWKLKKSLSLGMFIFVTDDPFFFYEDLKGRLTYDEFFTMLAVHEYGHTIQSLMFGPLYLILVGLPSIIWADRPSLVNKRMRDKISYFSVFPEDQANRLGEKFTGLKSPGRI